MAVIHSHQHLLARAAPSSLSSTSDILHPPAPAALFIFSFSHLLSHFPCCSFFFLFFNFHFYSADLAATSCSHQHFCRSFPSLLTSLQPSCAATSYDFTPFCFTFSLSSSDLCVYLSLCLFLSFARSFALSLPAPGCVP